MTILNKVLQKTSSYFLMGILLFTPQLLIAEKQDHADEHKGEPIHAEHGHKDEDEHKDEDRGDTHENHKDEGEQKDNHKEHEKSDDKHSVKSGGHDDHGDGDGDGDDHEKEEAGSDVELSKAQIMQAGIETMRLKKQSLSKQISALSEVRLNQYRTVNVSSTITTRVEKRHVRLGDNVKKGDLLVTLHTISTPDMSANLSADALSRADLNASITTTIAEMEANIAQAKGELAAASATWDRLRALGEDAVSGKRYTTARIAREQATATLKAYQRSRSKIKNLGKPKSNKPFIKEHYELRAEQGGVIIKDEFVLGQIVNPEDVLFVISDMKHLWVEANMKPNQVAKITLGAPASIKAGDKTLKGKVINIGRILDEKTRTLAVRIEVNTAGASLYPGQYVKTNISSQSTQQVIVVPAEAVLRSPDGDWMLFVEEVPGRFIPKEIEIVENIGDKIIINGLESGTIIVSKGAFTLQSELAKSGFNIHNH